MEPEMIARTRKLSTRSSQDALAAFVQKAEIDAMLTRLQALSDDHFGLGPDEVTWGDVTPLADYAELLSASPSGPLRKANTPSDPPRSPDPAPRGQGRRGSRS
jgi:hypothetical protein